MNEIALAWYSEGEYSKFLLLSADPDVWDKNYESWKKRAEDTIQMLEQEDARIVKVSLNFDEVERWCALKRKQNIAASRSEFAASKLKDQNSPGS